MKPTTDISEKSPWVYGLLLLLFIYMYFQILAFSQGNIQNILLGGLYFIEFGVHEASHIVFGFLPPLFVAAAGSFGELVFTGLIVVAAFRAKSYFAGIFGLLWFMMAMTSVGNYMADARAQSLPLIGPSDQPVHDWNFVFGQLGWLSADTAIGGTFKVLGAIIGALALMYGVMLIVSMIANRQSRLSRSIK